MPKPYPRFNRRHQGVMLWLLDHPAATLTQCAAELGYSRTWVSRIVNSPEFRQRYSAAMGEVAREKIRNLLSPPTAPGVIMR
jgi:hypothetical protein